MQGEKTFSDPAHYTGKITVKKYEIPWQQQPSANHPKHQNCVFDIRFRPTPRTGCQRWSVSKSPSLVDHPARSAWSLAIGDGSAEGPGSGPGAGPVGGVGPGGEGSAASSRACRRMGAGMPRTGTGNTAPDDHPSPWQPPPFVRWWQEHHTGTGMPGMIGGGGTQSPQLPNLLLMPGTTPGLPGVGVSSSAVSARGRTAGGGAAAGKGGVASSPGKDLDPEGFLDQKGPHSRRGSTSENLFSS